VRSQVEDHRAGWLVAVRSPLPPRAKRSSSCRYVRRCSSATTTSAPSILLGLIREARAAPGPGEAGGRSLVRQQVIQLLSGYGPAGGEPKSGGPSAASSSSQSEGGQQGSLVLDSSAAASPARRRSSTGHRPGAELERVMQVSRTKNNPVLSASPAWARPPSSRPGRRSSTRTSRDLAGKQLYTSTSAHSSPAAATAVISRSA
jgi:hypothetical protein